MATWKKVLVSGSAIEVSQLNVGPNQQITPTQATTFLSGSFTGSFTGNGAGLTGVTATAVFPTTLLTPLTSTSQVFVNDGANKYATVGQFTASAYAGVSGDITISAAGVAAIAANSVALGTDTTGDYVASITSGNGLTGGASGEGSTPTLAVGAGTHITVNPDDVAVNTTTLLPALSGSIFTTVSGDITISTAGVASIAANSVALGTDTTGDYVSTITAGAGVFTTGASSGETIAHTVSINSGSMLAFYTGSTFSTVSGDITITAAGVAAIGTGVIVNADVNAAAAIAASKINFASTGIVSASVLSSPAQGEALLTTNGVAGSTVDLGLQTSDSPTFAGLTITNGNVAINNTTSTALTTTGTTAAVFNTNATTVNAFGAATTINIGASTGITTINNDTRIKGALYVDGPVTAISSSNLYVADQFILLASGSATAGDGGIIIDRGSDAAGNIGYGFDSTTDRWGFQSGMADGTNAIIPTSANGVSGSFVTYLFTEADHGATKPITGEFAVVGSHYMDNAGNFWVYTV